ncbi:hypothetical protein LXL04_021825 [Taraxacum kok-saghyz]
MDELTSKIWPYLAKAVLVKIWNWCDINPPNCDSALEIISYAANWGNCPKRKILIAIIYGYMWCLWKLNLLNTPVLQRISTNNMLELIESKNIFFWNRRIIRATA